MDRNAEGRRTRPGYKLTKVAPLPCTHFKLQMHSVSTLQRAVAETGPVKIRSPAVFLAPSYYINRGIVMLNNCIAYAFLNAKH